MIIKKFTQDEFVESEIFEQCEEIYLDKFFLEYEYSLEGISDLIFYTCEIDSKVIGFGSYQDNSFFYLIDIVFSDEFSYSDKHDELFDLILKDIDSINNEGINVCLYQAFEQDYNYYLSKGFHLYKDYEQFFEPGRDLTRFVLQKNKY